MKQIEFTTALGIPMRVLYLPPGETGAYPAAVADKAQVEFYDTRYDFTEYGQFTGGRYYADTLLAERTKVGVAVAGLDLQGGVPDWTVDAASMVEVLAFIREQEAVDA